MDPIVEAKKFVWRAQDALNLDEKAAHLKMAEWWLSKATEERDELLTQPAPS